MVVGVRKDNSVTVVSNFLPTLVRPQPNLASALQRNVPYSTVEWNVGLRVTFQWVQPGQELRIL